MKLKTYIILFLVLASLLAITAVSQKIIPAVIEVTENQDCVENAHTVMQDVYGNVTRSRIKWVDCEIPENLTSGKCIDGNETYQSYEYIGKQAVTKNDKECRTSSFAVKTTKGPFVSTKEIDFADWGVCVKSEEDGCTAITCGTLKGGSARNGVFNGCDGGKSCQKFLFCGGEVKVLEKASRNDFAEKDPTFRLPKLDYEEAQK